jgi:hypothetical protein
MVVGAITREDAPFIDGPPSPPPETGPAPNIDLSKFQTYTQICFNGISLVSEVVLLIMGWSSNEYNVSKFVDSYNAPVVSYNY